VHGNHLSLYNSTYEAIWNIRTGEFNFREANYLLTSGLSPDENTLIKITAGNDAQFSIYKICPEGREYYDTITDSCKKKIS
jgi:hypothetical protein